MWHPFPLISTVHFALELVSSFKNTHRCRPFVSSITRGYTTSLDSIDWVENLDTSTKTNSASPFPSPPQLSILSWNILAQCLFDSSRSEYPHVKPETPLDWSNRLEKILHEITEACADIVCLQEVEFEAYRDDLRPAMKIAGYDSILQKDNGHQSHSLATFWKRDRLSLENSAHRSRTMTTVMKDNALLDDDALIAIVNCHLQGNPLEPVTRVKQLQNALSRSKRISHHGLVVCGDMNCFLRSSACSTYLSLGHCSSVESLEWGFLQVSNEIADIPPHKYKLSSAYPPELGVNDPSQHFTFCHSPGRPAVGIDQIWYTPSSLHCMGLRRPCKSDKQRLEILRTGLPNHIHPSDHMPVGCIFRWVDKKDGGLKELKENDQENLITSSDPDELRTEAQELLASYPFANDAQRKEFEYISSEVPGVTLKGGKPTDEQMAQLMDRRERREKLFSILPKKGEQILKRVLRLRKEASKHEP